MGRVDEATRAAICEALAGKAGDEAKLIFDELTKATGLSRGYLYRLSHGARRNGRALRKDAGGRKTRLTPAIEQFMIALTARADLSADTILYLTARHFDLPDTFMTRTTYNIWLRRQRLSRRDNKRDLRPYRAFEAAQANELHHYDTTVAEAYYANADGSIGYEPHHKRYKNKPGNKRPRLVLYSLIDDYSRVLFARFYFSENTMNLLDFVLQAWAQKADRRFPFYGIPTALYSDLGKPQRSEKFLRAMAKLGVRPIDTTPSHATPHGSRKHGKVERTFGEGLLGEFMKLTLVYNFAALEELNGVLWDWLIHLNNRVHSVTKEKRFARWTRSVGTPRSMPNEELFSLLHYSRAERVVSANLQLSLNGKQFQLPYRRPFINWVGVRVEAYWVPGQEDKISVVYDHHEEELSALAPVIDLAGDYKKVAETDHERRRAQADQTSLAGLNLTDAWKTNLPYLPRKGQQFDETKIAEKTIVTAEGKQRPSHAPMRYIGHIEVTLELLDDFDDTDVRNTFVTALMAGREKISEDDLTLAQARLRAQRATGTEG